MVKGYSYITNAAGLPLIFKSEEMTTFPHAAPTLKLYNIRPRSHTSTVPIDTPYLLYYIFQIGGCSSHHIQQNKIDC